MNKQGKIQNNRVVGGIEWVKTIHPDGTETQGFTWNPVRGCHHACRWTMPDGTIAICYAETIATKVAQSAYPHGFEHHYWNPHVLDEPLKVQEPARIFLDSMSDLMGKWVPDEQIEAVLDVARRAHWHTFQLLTKNAPRIEQFNFPPNVWVGVSAPPTSMLGKSLTLDQQKRLVKRQLEALSAVRGTSVRWMSIEPLSFDIAPLLVGAPLDWVVIGAATNGRRMYQPEPQWVEDLLALMDKQSIPVFFKGNLQWSPWREEFPTPKPVITPTTVYEIQGWGEHVEHEDVLVSGRFEMLKWTHRDDKRLVLGLMRDTVTDQKRYTVTAPNNPMRPITIEQAEQLIGTGEFLPVNFNIEDITHA